MINQCPLQPQGTTQAECIKEKCAWWVDLTKSLSGNSSCCVLININRALWAIANKDTE